MTLPWQMILVSVTAVAAVTDTRSGTIPNRLTLPVLALAPAAHWLAGGPMAGALSLVGLLVCALPPLVLFWLGGLGGGDLKLFAAVGAIAGAGQGLEVQTTSYTVAGVIAVVTLVRRRQLSKLVRAVARVVARRASASQSDLGSLRLGAPIFVAALFTVLSELW